jgi:preprotein translocase subunit SecG
MYQLVLLIHVFIAICIVGLVLVQQGKGSAIGAAFGSGASQTMFGSRGSGSFLLKTTIAFVVIFFATSISLNYIASRAIKQNQQVSLPVGLPDSSIAPVSPSSIPGEASQPIGNEKK